MGGAAGVYLARLDGPRGFERVLALKVVHEHLLDDQDFIATFLDEANLAVRLAHPNIVHTYELGHQGGLLFMAMEYLPGKPLSRVYRRAFELGQPLPYDLIAWIFARAADALHYAHTLTDEHGKPLSVVHRDVSPDNLIVTYDGQPKLIDFGIARAEGRIGRTELGQVKGKFRYMSPEYALRQEFDHTLDLFALGATLYEVALGLAAFEGGDEVRTLERLISGDIVDPTLIRPDFPKELVAILRRAIDPEVTRRYTSGAHMAADLDAFAGLDAREATARLSGILRELFREELLTEAGWITELRGLRAPSTEAELTPTQHQITVTPRRPERRSHWIPAALIAGVAATSLPWFLRAAPAERAPDAERPPSAAASAAPSAPVEERVALDVSVQPASANATIEVDGRLVHERPARVLLPRSSAPIRVQVSAEGFEAALLEVVPDRDHFLIVPLVARAPTAPTASSAPVGKSAGKPSPRPAVATSASVPEREPPRERPPESGVIRENPFQASW